MNKNKPVDKIIEGNEAIAEFMGGKLKYYNLSNEPYYQLNKQQWMPERLIYHTSFDWLMPVVEKIESLGFRFKMCRRRVEIERDLPAPPAGAFDLSITTVIGAKEETKIKSVWLAVVEFINWYNQTQNK